MELLLFNNLGFISSPGTFGYNFFFFVAFCCSFFLLLLFAKELVLGFHAFFLLYEDRGDIMAEGQGGDNLFEIFCSGLDVVGNILIVLDDFAHLTHVLV